MFILANRLDFLEILGLLFRFPLPGPMISGLGEYISADQTDRRFLVRLQV